MGAGRLGGALGRGLHRAGYPVSAIASRTPAHAQSLARATGARVLPVARLAERADVIFLCVPDDAIREVADAIGTTLPAVLAARTSRRPLVVAHCSGAQGVEPLQACAQAGAAVAGFHPLQSFADASQAQRNLPGTWVAIEAAPRVEALLTRMARALGCHPFRLAPGARALYHAAAVVASNYVVTLYAQAVEMLQLSGLDPHLAQQALMPLLRGTLENLAHPGLPQALTGPIARGDVGTVARHLATLDALPGGWADIYRELGAATIPVATRRGLDPGTAARLAELLGAPLPPRSAGPDRLVSHSDSAIGGRAPGG